MKINIKEILATMSPKERMAYIWDYYKFHIIGTIVAIILLISLITSFDEKKEVYLNMTIVGNGVNSEGVVQLQEQLTNKLVIDKTNEEVLIQTLNYDKSSRDPVSLAGVQKLAAEISTGSIDLLIVDKELFEEFSSQQSLLALNDVTSFDTMNIKKQESSNNKIYGLDTSDLNLLTSLEFDENMILCIPGNTKNLNRINEFFTLISE
ncbi:hypothetical protein [Bacillus sp. OK048]|uniref:hypothetical protein n=1 Tax=Bacillus sp. OK048 TaxID=1882761 RepID=UPI000B82AE40|nr:hypothetical protein [Bacillus sp. OK048]